MNVTFPNESADYRAAREHLLQQEIALRRQMEAVAAARRLLPVGGVVPEDYVFDGLGPDGAPAKIKLTELFAPGKDTLVVYNFMFPRMPEDTRPGPATGATATLMHHEGPCPSCTALLDELDGSVPHLEQTVNVVVVAKAPLDRLTTYAGEREWKNLRLLSSAGNNFKRAYHAELPDGSQMPMMNVFQRSGGQVHHFWSSELFYAPTDPGQDPRHIGPVEMLWNVLDLTPGGRPDGWEEQIDYTSPQAHCCR